MSNSSAGRIFSSMTLYGCSMKSTTESTPKFSYIVFEKYEFQPLFTKNMASLIGSKFANFPFVCIKKVAQTRDGPWTRVDLYKLEIL